MSKPSAVDLGQRIGHVTVVGLAQGPRQPNGRASGRQATIRCDCGQVTTVQARKLARTTNATCGQCSGKAKRPADGIPGYVGAHHRVERARGKAREHACESCGNPADQWSLQIATPAPLYAELSGQSAGLVYSDAPEAYTPRCRPCHRREDTSLSPAVRVDIKESVAWDTSYVRRGS